MDLENKSAVTAPWNSPTLKCKHFLLFKNGLA